MILKKYHRYLVHVFIKNLLFVSVVFACISFFLNIFEEIKFFEVYDSSFYYPILLTLLNIPSILFEIFPFIFLISTMYCFIYLYERDEMVLLNNNGIDNFKIILILTSLSVFLGIIIITIFYTFSSNLKTTYLNLKNNFSNKNEFLAMVNENGLWVKENFDNGTSIINAKKFNGNYLEEITITNVDENYKSVETIVSSKVNIKTKKWLLEDVKIFKQNELNQEHKKYNYNSFFNAEFISSLFSNLNALNIYQLHNLIDNYIKLGYSTLDTKIQLNKLYSLPFYLLLMTLLGSILMFKLKFVKSKINLVIIGVFASVVIYYINYFSMLFGKNETLPLEISIWVPYIILGLACSVGIVRINEK